MTAKIDHFSYTVVHLCLTTSSIKVFGCDPLQHSGKLNRVLFSSLSLRLTLSRQLGDTWKRKIKGLFDPTCQFGFVFVLPSVSSGELRLRQLLGEAWEWHWPLWLGKDLVLGWSGWPQQDLARGLGSCFGKKETEATIHGRTPMFAFAEARSRKWAPGFWSLCLPA